MLNMQPKTFFCKHLQTTIIDSMSFGRATLRYRQVAGDNRLKTVGYKTFGWRQLANDIRHIYNRIMAAWLQMAEKL